MEPHKQMYLSVKPQTLVLYDLVTQLILAAEGHKFFWPIDSTVTGTDNAGHSGPGSNANEELLYILKAFE